MLARILRRVSRLPLELDPGLAVRLEAAFDREGKIVRALESLGPVAGRDVVAIEADAGPIARGLVDLGARLAPVSPRPDSESLGLPAADASADVIVSAWSTFRGVDEPAIREVDRVLRAGGRQLVVHDYGRDDVARLSGERPEHLTWSDRNGPFLSSGFKVRVLHCWWTFDSLEDARSFLTDAFGEVGTSVGALLKRPRLAHKIAIYHRAL